MTSDEVTGVFDSASNQKFTDAFSMKASINRLGRLMRHPLENGSSVVDHFIIEPIEIELFFFVGGDAVKDTYAEVVQTFLAGEVMTVQTKVDSYPNMVIEAMPHEETSDMIDGLAFSIKMVEAKFIEVLFTPAPRKASNSPTVKRGEQAPKESVLFSIFK